MKQSHPYPLPLHALDDFRHPAEWHLFHHSRLHAGEVLAGNGYVALRATKGAWLDSDHQPATAEYLGRFSKLPWARWGQLVDDWRPLDAHRGRIFERAQHGLWLDGRLAPSPVWAVNEIRVRLSLLQVVARLPRAEVYCGSWNADDPLWFRFSGGIGLIARDARLTMHSFEIYGPARDSWNGERLRPQKQAAVRFRGAGSMANWPPAEPTES